MNYMNKKSRYEIIEKYADEMAKSGGFCDWLSIEHALRCMGFTEARQVLDDTFRRQEINELCRQSRNGNSKAGSG